MPRAAHAINRCTMSAMDATANGQTAPRPSDDDVLPTGWRWSVPRFLGVAAFLGMAVFWAWALANGNSVAHPDEFDDPVFTEAAETVCAARQAAINELPLATAADTPQGRSELIELGTAQLDAMVNELSRLAPPTDPQGASGVEQWLADYQLYLNDRRRYADVLATGDDPPFVISGTAEGVRVTDLLTTFADVNNMRSCGPSGDV